MQPGRPGAPARAGRRPTCPARGSPPPAALPYLPRRAQRRHRLLLLLRRGRSRCPPPRHGSGWAAPPSPRLLPAPPRPPAPPAATAPERGGCPPRLRCPPPAPGRARPPFPQPAAGRGREGRGGKRAAVAARGTRGPRAVPALRGRLLSRPQLREPGERLRDQQRAPSPGSSTAEPGLSTSSVWVDSHQFPGDTTRISNAAEQNGYCQ